MKKIVVYFIMAVFIFSAYGAAVQIFRNDEAVFLTKLTYIDPPAELWSTTIGGGTYDVAYQAQETDEGFLIFGTTASYGQGERDYFLVKLDVQGKEMWNRTYGGERDDVGHNILPAIDGGFLLMGVSTSYGAGRYDICIIKIDEEGHQEWMKLYGGATFDVCESIIEAENSGYILVGYTNSYGSGDYDMWVINIDSQGTILWEQRFGGPFDEMGSEIKTIRHGEYVILGHGNNQSILITINERGELLTERHIQYNETPTVLNNVEVLDNGGFVLSGYCVSTDVIQTPLALEIDRNGTIVWSQTYVSEGTRGSFWTAIHSSTNGFLFGGFKESDEMNRAWVVKTNVTGEQRWENTYFQTGIIEEIMQTRDDGFVLLAQIENGDKGIDIEVLRLAAEACPETPVMPVGKTKGKIGASYTYETSTSHPSSDMIWYQWDWGDNETSEWLGPYPSGVPCEVAHTWVYNGTYVIRVKAKDSADCESGWSEPLEVSMHKGRTYNPIMQVMKRELQQVFHL